MKTKIKIVTKPKAVSFKIQHQLSKLKKQINQGHQATEMLIKSSKDKSRQALQEAILTGKALVEAKKIIPYGGFRRWIEKEIKSLKPATATRYILLSQEYSHVSNLVTTNLRKAYILLGIIDDPTNEVAIANETTDADIALTIGNNGSGNTGVESNNIVSTLATKSRRIITPNAPINPEDHLSRAKYLADQLLIELNNKIINNLISNVDARQIVQQILDGLK
jgi:hypothetical protein